MKKIAKQVIAVVLMAVMLVGIIPESIQAATDKVPTKFKTAKELEFGELYELKTTERYTFEVDKSGRFDFYFDNGPTALLYDQTGKYIFKFASMIDMGNFSYYDGSSDL